MMTELSEEPSAICSMLDLPDAIIDSIATPLAQSDKVSFMAVCRKAALVTLLSAGIIS
jgi:hypothetical protein